MSGSLVTTLSDHFAQIWIVPIYSGFSTDKAQRTKKDDRDFQEILRNKCIISRDLQNTNWDMELGTPVKLRKCQHIN